MYRAERLGLAGAGEGREGGGEKWQGLMQAQWTGPTEVSVPWGLHGGTALCAGHSETQVSSGKHLISLTVNMQRYLDSYMVTIKWFIHLYKNILLTCLPHKSISSLKLSDHMAVVH